ncbi:hypothetical protein Cni_G08505 [Canna indica]|uniref:Large ribosomal RNA subunit accumulation protein YCED homolog 1, chloroplastic n=1 Tax=Canna indica TaxID=4628 RepID=A0AAQ3K298_9LILI|nr:hypothetical protein Cni_G08505 [Canna indica]
MALSFTHTSFPRLVKFYRPDPKSPPSLSIPIPTPFFTSKSFSTLSQSAPLTSLKASSSSFTVFETTDFGAAVDDLGSGSGSGEGDEDLAGSPWEGAVLYRRDPSVSHVEYCTTLERLGLGKLSSGLSRSRAATMGIRLPIRRAKNSAFGDQETPVLVSLDVTRKKRRLKLDGIVRTVITLRCNRCAEPAAECVFSNFNLLLTEDLIEEPDEINLGTIYGEERHKNSSRKNNEEEKDDEDGDEIDMDDRLFFPAEEKEIDISKHIRDLIHVEITINAICDARCKGICLRCGTNLNNKICNCNKNVADDDASKDYNGPLKGLRKQMQKT